MSKRHHASRRRTYGRRQHELHERLERRERSRSERAWRAGSELGLEPLAYVDGRSGDPSYGFSE